MAQHDLICSRHRATLRAHATSERYRAHPLAQALLAALDLIDRLECETTERELRHSTASASADYAELFAVEFGKRSCWAARLPL